MYVFDSTELHLSVFSVETIGSDKMSIDISDTLKLLYFVKKISEHRYDIRISESCADPNPLMVKRQDPDIPGRVAQSVTCLATDVCLTAIPGVASSTPTRSHTFVEIDHEIISTVILLPSADSFKKGCCQLQANVCARITGYLLVQACPGKSVVR